MNQKEVKPERFFEGVPDRTFEQIDVPPKPKPDNMFKKIWNSTKNLVTKTLFPIISNQIAIDKLLPFIQNNLDISVRVYDKDKDGDTELVIRVLFQNKTILIREVKI